MVIVKPQLQMAKAHYIRYVKEDLALIQQTPIRKALRLDTRNRTYL